MNLLASPWFWGFCGAFIYAAPRFSACLFGRRPAAPCVKCYIDGVFSMAVGPIAAGAFTGEAQALLHTSDVPAVAALIGLMVNPVAPSAIEVFTQSITRRVASLVNGDRA